MDAEIRSMLMCGGLRLTLGQLEQLFLIRSPYVGEGVSALTADDVSAARSILGEKDSELSDVEFSERLVSELDTAFRAYEIIVPDAEAHGGRVSDIRVFSPEWLADTISQACAAMPSLTYGQVLWEMPLTLVLHLAVSTARRNGVITERRLGVEDALKQLRERRNNG